MNPANVINDLYIRVSSYFRVKCSEARISKARESGDVVLGFGPSSINLMMADTCNSQCIMCGKDYRFSGSGNGLSLEDVKKVYKHLHMNHVVDVIYGGGGEPFLNVELTPIAEYTHRQFPVIQHTIISNFMEWKPDTVRRLLDNHVHFLISVNAASRETFKKISGMDAFERVIANVKKLIRMRRETSTRVHVALSMILMRQNIDELCDFLKLAASMGADEVKTLYVRIYPESYRQKKNRDQLITPQDSLFFNQEKADEILQQAENLSRQIRIKFSHEPLFQCAKSCGRNCDEPWKSLFINFNGDVYPCPASEILFKHKVDSARYRSGNILKQPIHEIWNNPFWIALRKTNRIKDPQEIVPECSCCGNAINWLGTANKKAHMLDWKKAEDSNLKL